MFCVCLRQICGSYFYMIYMKISDEGLWELCLKGDMRAFRELYCRFYALLRQGIIPVWRICSIKPLNKFL